MRQKDLQIRRPTMPILFIILHLCLFTSCAKDETKTVDSFENLEKKILKIAQKRNLPALALQVKTSEAVLDMNYHHPDTEKQTVYGIGSTTKFLSATLVFKLIEDGEIEIEDKAIDYVQDLGGIEGGDEIRIYNLLNHTSGLSDYTMNPVWRKAVVFGKGPIGFEEKFGYVNSELKANGTYSYSNTNYLILQRLVEVILSVSYETSFNEFYENRGLENIKMGYSGSDLQAFYGESDQGSANVSAWQENYGYDGGAYSTPDDLNSFLKKFFVEKSLIDEKTIAQMTNWISTDSMSIQIGDGSISEYGNGIMKLQYNGNEYLGHAGGTLKYQSFMFYDIKNDVFISLVTNCSGKHYNNVFFQEIIPLILNDL